MAQMMYDSPLAGKLFDVIGVSGAGKALAYGEKEKGARVVVANRIFENFHPEDGMILANTTSVGTKPRIDETLIPKKALKHYSLVFDAIYTPKLTVLLRKAQESGASVVSGQKCSFIKHLYSSKDLVVSLHQSN
ncbi:NAD(P)-binding domain containing protein [Parasponia andersonii]|uniref:NAD(P)-binding domain containing protein n=1 Tax=Parasponia andersonii TaxID=3476 RepID=A0A2P5DL14_PARAD|nr:NAD(P)-binding domain containing protein [Parasponia andersonii]